MQNHGWVRPNPSGVVARCGGPGICPECAKELSALPPEDQINYQKKASLAKKRKAF